MRGVVVAVALILTAAVSVRAADEVPPPALTQPLPTAATSAATPTEETPGFQAMRPLPAAEPVPVASPAPVVSPAPTPAPTQPSAPLPPEAASPPAPAPAESPLPARLSVDPIMALVAVAILLLGAVIAGMVGVAAAGALHRRETVARRAAAAATLALELETRLQAFDAVPVPPNADAGVSFVSAVAALASLDQGWRAVQGSVHLLPDRLAGHLSVHYAAVHHVANHVKGQSIAAAVRMLQANRIGGHPSPDAAAMREAHVELAAAFRGVDKIIQGLKG